MQVQKGQPQRDKQLPVAGRSGRVANAGSRSTRGDASPEANHLPPRVRRVLECLLRGQSEKEAANELGLRPNTVHSYAKLLYKRLGVRSRGELLARCLRLQ